MSSSIVSSEGMLVGVKRFMPTVGCEADAVAYVEDSQRSLRSLDGQEWEAKTILSDGSYRWIDAQTYPRIAKCDADFLSIALQYWTSRAGPTRG